MKILAAVMIAFTVMLPLAHSPQASASETVVCPDGSVVPVEEAADCPRIELPDLTVNRDPCALSGEILGIPAWYKYLDGERTVTVFDGRNVEGKCSPVLSRNDDGSIDPSSFTRIGLAVLEAMMVIAGFVAVIMIFWGSFLFILTRGEPDKAASARRTVINAAVGLAIVIIATRVVSFLGERLSS